LVCFCIPAEQERIEMSVRLRLKRLGNRHRPFYRVTVVDQRRKRDGRVIEELGWYNPLEHDEAKQVELKTDRCAYWLSVGAQPSDTVAMLLRRSGLDAKSGTKAEKQPAKTGS
jgi:small subunit ribosomal protein S16